MSKTSIPLTRDIKQDLQSQQNLCSLHVRNYQRIWDAQKHLLLTCERQINMFVNNSRINVIIQENVENV